MPGYREFRPGEIWFYYNPNVSKELERKKELGAITSRPVIIVQSAYYPEWTDSVTVIPMTSSDRRSGIHIDTTILHDGSIIEGGTALPYLFYTVKTKYLHAMTSDIRGEKLHLISLSPEDYALIQQAMSYHLGFSSEVPEYVRRWKSLNDYDRSTIIKQIKLVVNDFDNQQRKVMELIQERDDSPKCENHVNASFDKLSPDRTQFIIEGGKYPAAPNATPPKPSSLLVSEAKNYKRSHPQPSILFSPVSINQWAETVEPHMSEGAVKPATRIYPGSTLLANVAYNQIHTALTQEELDTVANMSTAEVMENTGAPSKGTAYRIRKWAASHQSTMVISDELSAEGGVGAFRYSKDNHPSTRRRRAKNLKRVTILLGLSPQECDDILKMNVDTLQGKFPQMAPSEIKQLKADIAMMYPNRTLVLEEKTKQHNGVGIKYSDLYQSLTLDAEASVDAEFNVTYELWETLSPSEVAEIASASKRNAINVAKKYGLTKAAFTALRPTVIEVAKPNGKIKQPEIDESRKSIVCNRVINEDLTTISSADILIFCRTEYSQIVSLYGISASANTPSKKDIAELKKNLRKIIVRKKSSIR